MSDEQAEVKQALRDYVADFSTLDLDVYLRHYHKPLMMARAGGVTVLQTVDDMKSFFAATVERLKSEGYGRSEWEEIEVQVLSDKTAYANATATRYKKDGSVLERAGTSYVMYKSDEGWQVAAMMSRTR